MFHFYLSKENRFWQVDSRTYNLVAQGVAAGKGISDPTGKPNFYRLPGYPIFLAFFYKIFGTDERNPLWAQVVLGSLIPILIFFLSVTLFSQYRFVAYAASVLSSIHLGLILYSGFLMTETLFILLLLLFFIFFFSGIHLWFCRTKSDIGPMESAHYQVFILPDPIEGIPILAPRMYELVGQHNREAYKHEHLKQYVAGNTVFRDMLLAGLFLGLASLVRPVGHYLFFLALIIILLSHGSLREKIRKAIPFSFMWLLPVSIWLIRNYMMLGHIFFHTLPGGHFLYLSAARVASQVHKVSYIQARLKLSNEVNGLIKQKERDQKRSLNEIEQCYVHEAVAKKYFWMHPWQSLTFWLTDMFRTCLSLYSAELLYIESGRQALDYFAPGRTIWSWFERYLFPRTENIYLKAIVYGEIVMFLFLLIGYLFGFVHFLISIFKQSLSLEVMCSWVKALPYMKLFIVIALAGGYARMRLPIEPLIIILSCYGWMLLIKRKH